MDKNGAPSSGAGETEITFTPWFYAGEAGMTDENRDDGMRVEVANGEQTFELSFADKCLLISADTRHSERRSTN